MFEESLIVSGTERRRSRVKWYFLFTAFVYLMAIGGLILSSILLFTPQLAESVLRVAVVAPPPPPPPPPPPAGGQQPTTVATPKAVVVPVGFVAPTVVPKSLPPTAGELPEASGVVGVPGGVPGGVIGGVLGGVPGGVVGGVLGSTGPVTAPVPPPPPKVEAPPPANPVRITTGVLKGNAIRRVMPQYPLVARKAQLQGSVDVAIVVDEEGNVVAAAVVSGHPLLREAALQAARQWKFRPTLVSGQPVKVTGVLTFVFQLHKEGAIG